MAAYTYAELKGRKFTRVVVIAPSHYVAFDFTSVYDGDAYATPLGNVPVDKEFAQQLVKMSSTMQLSGRGHPTADAPNMLSRSNYPGCKKCWAILKLCPSSWETRATKAAALWEWRWQS